MASVVPKLMVIGRVMEKLAPKIALVEVQTNQMDDFLHMWFSRFAEYRVDDRNGETKPGDLVLIRTKEKNDRLDLPHEVAQVVVRAGQIRDPLTGKRVVQDVEKCMFLEDLEKISKLLPDYKEQVGLKYEEGDMDGKSPLSSRDLSQ